jgi:hypothetical protein
LPAVGVFKLNEELQLVQAPVVSAHVVQFAEQLVQTLFDARYYVDWHVQVLSAALKVKDDLQALHVPVQGSQVTQLVGQA